MVLQIPYASWIGTFCGHRSPAAAAAVVGRCCFLKAARYSQGASSAGVGSTCTSNGGSIRKQEW